MKTTAVDLQVETPFVLSIDNFANMGVELHHDDLQHLQRTLPLRLAERNTTIRAWLSEYRSAFDEEPAAHRKQNAGIRSANLWLLEHVRGAAGAHS